MNNYKSAKSLLTSQGKFYINLGLERISAILNILGNPQDKLQCIHVAGTNGKGSVCAIIESVLRHAGLKTGLYTSPHIFEYTERIKVNGQDISEDKFAELIFDICNLAEQNDIHLTEFEILTAAAFKYFAEQKCEVVILETGLGGRFDATNVIKKNLCAIITHIDLDHTERLGSTKDKIAFEKAGIIKENCPVFICEGYEAIRNAAGEKNALLSLVTPYEDTSELALKGTFQQENLSLALAAIRYLLPQITRQTINEGLHNVKHPCRFEYVQDKNLIIDAAHNPNGAAALRKSLEMYFPDTRRRFVFGCLRNKDYEKMMKILFTQGDEIHFYHFNNANSCTFEELQKVCEFPSQQFISLDDLYKKDMGILTVVCGSFYMLSEVLKCGSPGQ